MDIVGLCDGNRSLREISKIISKRRDEDYDVVLNDAVEYMEGLVNIGLLDSKEIEIPSIEFQERKILPEDLFLEITQNCNLKCKHCYISADVLKPKELTLDEIKKLIDELKSLGGKRITISGGEPLTRSEWIDIAEYASTKGLEVKLITNGTLITEEIAKKIKDLNISIQVSLEGAAPESNDKVRGTGSFDAATKGLDILLEAGLQNKIVISMTLNRWNIGEVDKMVEFLNDRKICSLHLSSLVKQGRASDNWFELLPTEGQLRSFFEEWYEKSLKLRERFALTGCFIELISRTLEKKTIHHIPPTGCTFGYEFRVDGGGNVYPCQLFVDPDYCLGNIRESSLAEILESEENLELRRLSYRKRHIIKACQECIWKNVCGGGCMARALSVNGSLLSPDDFCEIRHYLYRRILWDLMERAKAK